MNLIEDLKWRGLIHSSTDEKLMESLNNGGVSFYMGVDPTADSMHIGGLAALIFTKRLQQAGNSPYILIGGMTGMIGDPSGRTTERSTLDMDVISHNVQALRKQIEGVCGKEYNYINNIDWLDMPLSVFLRDFGKSFNVNQMLAKDIVASRLETGISFTEFSYQILQSIDFEYLFKTKNITLQVGGQDQWGNITAGLDLIRKRHGVEGQELPTFGITFPLLVKADGTKFGKSQAGNVWLDPKKSSEYQFYQFLFNQSDADVLNLILKLTFVEKNKFEELKISLETEPFKREAQKYLATEVTKFIHGQEGLDKALKITQALFSGDVADLTFEEIQSCIEGVPHGEIEDGEDILNVLVKTGAAKSRREAKEFVEAGSIMINGKKVEDAELIVLRQNAFGNQINLIKRGKRNYFVGKY